MEAADRRVRAALQRRVDHDFRDQGCGAGQGRHLPRQRRRQGLQDRRGVPDGGGARPSHCGSVNEMNPSSTHQVE